MNESSGIVDPPLAASLPSEQPGRLVCLAPGPALGSLETVGDFEKLGYVSENVESNETMEAALDRTGDM